MESYYGGETGQHIAIVKSKAGRDPRRRDGDAESQESIIGMTDQEMGSKKGVYVTTTVQIS